QEHERLAGGVGVVAGERLEAGGRRDVHHGAAAALDHPPYVPRVEVDDGLYLQAELLQLALAVRGREGDVDAEPGVVDQDLDGESAGLDLGGQAVARRRVREVGRDRLGAHAVV